MGKLVWSAARHPSLSGDLERDLSSVSRWYCWPVSIDICGEGCSARSVKVDFVGCRRRFGLWAFLYFVLVLRFDFGIVSLLRFVAMCDQEMNSLAGRICVF